MGEGEGFSLLSFLRTRDSLIFLIYISLSLSLTLSLSSIGFELEVRSRFRGERESLLQNTGESEREGTFDAN